MNLSGNHNFISRWKVNTELILALGDKMRIAVLLFLLLIIDSHLSY